ncbi:MAG: tRNA epoxyqueuosine(34) reductase QueG [Candidatus Dormibacteraeota bacterium]|nr:tRNA epoxyqueuosine(34) reductase QueG [Candidatus Dormibacteraeota bacterium]
MDADTLKAGLVVEAHRLGFVAAGVTSTRPFRQARRRALRAIDEGWMDGMPWYSRERVDAAADLKSRYPWARSILALAWPYRPAAGPGTTAPTGAMRGRMSAYACLAAGDTTVDYHSLLGERCDQLVEWLRGERPGVRAKRFIDHGWALDRAVAERAGLGFSGKHSQLITRAAGSYALLAEIVLSVALKPDQASKRGCGRCSACLPACPTGAIVAPGVIDARRCIAYLTIEHRGPIPHELRSLMGSWVFGCDLCQEACPINHRLAPPALDEQPATTTSGPVPYPDLIECLGLTDDEFRTRFRTTAVWRTGRAGLARNCAIALGNLGDAAARPHLERARTGDPDQTVREAAGWALERIAAAQPAR